MIWAQHDLLLCKRYFAVELTGYHKSMSPDWAIFERSGLQIFVQKIFCNYLGNYEKWHILSKTALASFGYL